MAEVEQPPIPQGRITPPMDRVTARNQVAQQWAQRRQEKTGKQPQDVKPVIAPSPRPAPLVPSLCRVIGKAWNEAVANIAETLQPPTAPKIKSRKPINSNKSFPSVLQILQASALHQEVELFTSNSSESVEEEALRVLPTGYDWNQAIWNMAESRSRAFLLLDLASIVKVLVEWKRQRPSPKIEFLYTVQFNADPKLLQVFLRSQVGLVCTNKWDLTKCRQALQLLQNTTDAASKTVTRALMYDNASQTGKPDGYIRQLLMDDDNASSVDTVVVDGPQEVTRVLAALQRVQQRRNRKQEQALLPAAVRKLYFVLKLPDKDATTENWQDCVQSTQHAIKSSNMEQGHIIMAALVGISVDVSAGFDRQMIENALDSVEGYWLSLLSSHGPGVRLDLTGVTMPPTEDTIKMWKVLSARPNLSHITVDVSHALVSPAGALCTRIIGVKEEKMKSPTNDTIGKDTEEDGKSNGNIRMHYYIDDGCYGSLYNAAEHNAISNPLPLGVDHDPTSDGDGGNSTTHTSTVWGPTCDGLDRVCRDIPLPKLHRDQWLVFPNLGCRIGEGLGTAFNGFAPPDTAYCVLGYWDVGGGSKKQ
jgi:Pyridoxal-dependent decarboxylase, C-terminal sheet domain